MFISAGCFASALTRSQVVAAMIALAFGTTLFLLSVLAEQFPMSGSWQAHVLSYFALFDQMHDFSRGIIDSRAVVLYLTVTFFFLFMTLRVVESRRWR
jgi:ABC-2 type transport system permease protein